MSRKKDSTVTVQVFGIEYPEFAKLKWQQFLRGFSLAVALLVLVVLFLAIGKQLPSEMPVSVILVLILVILAVFAVYRSNIRREHKRSGLANQRLEYQFDRDGWTVKAGSEQVRVLWSKTWRVRRNQNAPAPEFPRPCPAGRLWCGQSVCSPCTIPPFHGILPQNGGEEKTEMWFILRQKSSPGRQSANCAPCHPAPGR